ncbi:MAG: rhodanese-like domain-containing protein [Lautropia sp.]|nr:rhodanese-like domain-containing protein [Lautropia sp.]
MGTGTSATAIGQARERHPIWIDVRTPREYADGHLPGAVNLPLNELASKIEALVPDKDTPVMLYCRSGNRSGQALRILRGMGYTQAVNKGAYRSLIQQR